MAKSKRGGSRPGSGRKPSNPEGKTALVTATVPEELIAKLDELAEQRAWTRSAAVTEAIRRLVKTAKRKG